MTVLHDTDTTEVVLLGMSIDAFRSTSAYNDELFREFRLLTASEECGAQSVPARLSDLVHELDEHFTGMTSAMRAQLEEAVSHGDDLVDLRFVVPRNSRETTARFARLLRESDQFCREGDLLTLEPSEEVARFREWYIGEFIRQIDGEPPTRWSR